MNYVPATLKIAILALFLSINLSAQRFYPDDPIKNDPDNLPITKPAFMDISLVYDAATNSFGGKGEKILRRAQGINTLGEVPDSSWFTNRIGIRDMPIEELILGGNPTPGIDTCGALTVIGSNLDGTAKGLLVRDSRGDIYKLVFDQKEHPNLATGAAVISSKIFHAIGYNTYPASIVAIDYNSLKLDPSAEITLLGGGTRPLDQAFLDTYRDQISTSEEGLTRAVACFIPAGEYIGPFKFYDTRPDDPNDIFPHENRRELRGLRIFSAWLNHYLCHSMKTRDLYISEGGSSYVKHYLVDFTGTLGSGYNMEGRISPKNKQSGNEYIFPGDVGATLKTAATLGIWERPWMNFDFPYPELAEIGRIESDNFEPISWKPIYTNPAFERLFADDAFWAVNILTKFSDAAVRAIVDTAQYSDPEAAAYLTDVLIKRRDKIINYYLRQLNPLLEFKIAGPSLEFRNLGEDLEIGKGSTYEYQWHTFDNQNGDLLPLGEINYTQKKYLPIPASTAEYLVVLIRTRSREAKNWRKNIEVFLKNENAWGIAGINREAGIASSQGVYPQP